MYIYMFRTTTFGLSDQLHSQRIAAVCLVIYGLFASYYRKDKTRKEYSPYTYGQYRRYIIMTVILLGYGFLMMITLGKGNGNNFYDAMLNILIFTIPVIWSLTKIYDNLDDFMIVLTWIGIVQSIIIIYSLVDESFATMIDILYNDTMESDYSAGHRSGYAGGLGCITAPGAIKYATGLIAVSYLYVTKKRSYLLVVFAIFAILCSMIARTGLLFDLCCGLYIIKQSMKKGSFATLVIPLALIVYFIYSQVSTGQYDAFLSERYKRMQDLQQSGVNESFLQAYFSGSYPPLCADTFFGVGMVSGISGNGYLVQIDGGPLRIYSAIGLLFSVLAYWFLLKIMIKNIKLLNNGNDKNLMWLIIAIYIIADFKEMTFFIVWPMCIYFVIAILLERKGVMHQTRSTT